MALSTANQALLERAIAGTALTGAEIQQIKTSGEERAFLALVDDAKVKEELRRGGLM